MAYKDWMGTGADFSVILLKRNTLWNCAVEEDFNFPHTNWWTETIKVNYMVKVFLETLAQRFIHINTTWVRNGVG